MFAATRMGLMVSKALALPQINGQSTWTGTIDTTSHSITMPSGIVAGELLICIATVDGSSPPTPSSGWDLLDTANYISYMAGCVCSKIATGSDTLTLSIATNQRGTAIVYRVGNANTAIAESAQGFTSYNLFAAPSVSLSQSRQFLCIASVGLNGTNDCYSAPTNYTGFVGVQPESAANDPTYAAYRAGLAGSSVSPGNWSVGPAASIGAIGFTIAAYQA